MITLNYSYDNINNLTRIKMKVKDFLGEPLQKGDRVIYTKGVMFNLSDGLIMNSGMFDGKFHLVIINDETKDIIPPENVLKLTPSLKGVTPETKWVFCSVPKGNPYRYEISVAKVQDITKRTVSVYLDSGTRFMSKNDALSADEYVLTHPEIFL